MNLFNVCNTFNVLKKSIEMKTFVFTTKVLWTAFDLIRVWWNYSETKLIFFHIVNFIICKSNQHMKLMKKMQAKAANKLMASTLWSKRNYAGSKSSLWVKHFDKKLKQRI